LTLPLSLLAYATEISTLDRARDSRKGIRVEFPSHEAAQHYRFRLYQARNLDRIKNREIYPEGNALYGSSVYDGIICKLREDTDGHWWLYLEKYHTAIGYIEELPDDEVVEGDLP
jgi:hypothetical protein